MKTGSGSSQRTKSNQELTPLKIQRRTKVLPVRLGLNSLWLLSLLKRESDWQPRRGCHMQLLLTSNFEVDFEFELNLKLRNRISSLEVKAGFQDQNKQIHPPL